APGLGRTGCAPGLGPTGLEQGPAEPEGSFRDPTLYYLPIFGDPASHQPWGWRFEGHHLSLNFTSPVAALPAATPSFFGSNPNERRRPPGIPERVLAEEEDLARELGKSLDANQRKVPILSSSAPADL